MEVSESGNNILWYLCSLKKSSIEEHKLRFLNIAADE